MSVLTAQSLGQSFGEFDVFAGVSCTIPPGARIGLVGPNGIGKTTLLHILAGLSTPTAGTVRRSRGARIGYLPQEAAGAFDGRDHSVAEEMRTVFEGLHAQEERLHALEARMAAGETSDDLLARYGAEQEDFEHAGGYTVATRIDQVLEGLGFDAERRQTPLAHLSGGQKTRALLARLLLDRPDLLVLDEPTNHLDMEAVEWLEGALRTWDGAILVVSHDRYFLDRVADRIWELTRVGLLPYRGNYSAYVEQRAGNDARAQELYEAEMARLERELDFVRRNIAGQATSMAQGKLKRLSRQIVALEALGVSAIQGKRWSELGLGHVRPMTVDEAARRLGSLRAPTQAIASLGLELRAAGRGGDIVLRTRDVEVGYPGRTLFAADDIELPRRACAALIGPNGAGKTTFLRTILGELPPLAGEVRPGGGLKVGYLAQASDGLRPDERVIDALQSHRAMPEGEARGYLARYLFRGEDAFKAVGALSGGERARLALAILALDAANLLLLDEPTNHLDIPAQEALQAVLGAFDGTILLASHDRYLVDRLATQIWELGGGRLRVFEGNYQAYLAARESARRAAAEVAAPDGASSYETRRAAERAQEREARRRAEALAGLEAAIAALEAKLATIAAGQQAAGETGDLAEVRRLGEAYEAARVELDDLYAQWASLEG